MASSGLEKSALGERFREHQKAPSPIFDHTNISGHNSTIENSSAFFTYSSLFITTINTPLSAVKITLVLSLLMSDTAFCSSNAADMECKSTLKEATPSKTS